jgi:hypothetical protein
VGSSFIIGAFTFSIVLSALFNNDWYLYNRIGFSFILRTLPYFWVVSLAVFTILGEFYYKKTLLGYRRKVVVIVGIYLISTTLFGGIFYLIGFGGGIEETFENNINSYRGIILNRYEIWGHPEDGLLSGRVTKISNNEIEIVDLNGYFWTIDIRDAILLGVLDIKNDERVKITGKITTSNNFDAEEIRPW